MELNIHVHYLSSESMNRDISLSGGNGCVNNNAISLVLMEQ